VDPFPADAAQYPFPRQAEPSHSVGSLKYNPRDQFVTIIAWTQGEEAFVDANHNGQYDQGELFVDEGDPFIDANDNNVYDQVTTGGQWEQRFCSGTNTSGICPAYQPPNGTWDSLTSIWVPTWVVFTGGMLPRSTPTFGAGPVTQFTPSCADFADAPVSASHNSLITAPVYIYDNWYNTPAGGSSYTYGFIDSLLPFTSVGQGFVAEPESYGAMGALGVDFDYRAVSAKGGACNTSNGPACVLKLSFLDFDPGYRGTLVFQNKNKGTATVPLGCPTASPGAVPPLAFTMYVAATPPEGKAGSGLRGFFSGSLAVSP
jgi:hypothetical protein